MYFAKILQDNQMFSCYPRNRVGGGATISELGRSLTILITFKFTLTVNRLAINCIVIHIINGHCSKWRWRGSKTT